MTASFSHWNTAGSYSKCKCPNPRVSLGKHRNNSCFIVTSVPSTRLSESYCRKTKTQVSDHEGRADQRRPLITPVLCLKCPHLELVESSYSYSFSGTLKLNHAYAQAGSRGSNHTAVWNELKSQIQLHFTLCIQSIQSQLNLSAQFLAFIAVASPQEHCSYSGV